MRIVSGLYKGRKLKSPNNFKTRPTSDRLRETLFNILAPTIGLDTRFLDLCAGSGAIGIEALSRGCGFTSFVEIARKNCALIEQNLDDFQVPEEQTYVKCISAEKFLANTSDSFDLIYYDPPYREDYSTVLDTLGSELNTVLKEDGKLMVEHHFKKLIPDEIGLLRRWREIKQGEVCLSFFEKS